MKFLSANSRIVTTLLALSCVCPVLTSQDLTRGLWEDHEEYFETGSSSIERLFEARHPDLDWPKRRAQPYRLEVAFYREAKPMPSGLDKLDWARASEQMKKLSQSPPKGLLHHQRIRIREGQTATFGDLKTKSFFIDTNVELGSVATGNSPVIRSLQEGLSLCLRLQPGAEGLPRRLDLDLAWQKFPDKVQPMKVGLDLLPELDEFRSDFFRIQGSLTLGKRQAWLYRPGGKLLPNLAILILVEPLASPKPKSKSKSADKSDLERAWMVRIGKEHWTPKRTWAPIAAPLSFPTLDGLPTAIQEGAAQSYMSDMNVEVGRGAVLVDPEISVFLSGLRATLVIQALGDQLWVQLVLGDRTLDSMRDVPLEATLHGILRAPIYRSRFLRRDFLLEPGERLPLGSGVSVRDGDKLQRTRLWLQVDPLPTPH